MRYVSQLTAPDGLLVERLAGNAVVVAIETVGVSTRVVLLEEALCLRLAAEVRAIPITKCERGLSHTGKDEQGHGQNRRSKAKTTDCSLQSFLPKS